jgi:hypothetical protein
MALLFEPIELLEEPAALTPRPRINLVRGPGRRPSASHATQVVVTGPVALQPEQLHGSPLVLDVELATSSI